MTAAEAEIARLRRELEYAIEAARENGKERDELATRLGEMEALRDRLREVSRAASNLMNAARWIAFHPNDVNGWGDLERNVIAMRAALASGNGK